MCLEMTYRLIVELVLEGINFLTPCIGVCQLGWGKIHSNVFKYNTITLEMITKIFKYLLVVV